MKKVQVLAALLLTALLLSGCAQSQGASRSPDEVAAQYVGEVAEAKTPQPEAAQEGTPAVSPKEVPDIDLKDLSYPIVFAQVYDIAREAEKHVGKTLRMQGSYYGAQQLETDEVVHLILVTDSAGCCEVALEFAVTGNPAWPDDFPPNNSEILLTGVLDTITAGEQVYPLLLVNEIQVVHAAATPVP